MYKMRMHIGIGFSSLLMLLTIIILAILSVMSYMDAYQKSLVVNRHEQHILAVTTAEKEAWQLIDKLQEIVLQDNLSSSSFTSLPVTYDAPSQTITFHVEVSETQVLNVSLILQNHQLTKQTWLITGV